MHKSTETRYYQFIAINNSLLNNERQLLVFAPTQCIENTLNRWTRTTLITRVLTSVTSCSSNHKFLTNIRNITVTTRHGVNFKILRVLVIMSCVFLLLILTYCHRSHAISLLSYPPYVKSTNQIAGFIITSRKLIIRLFVFPAGSNCSTDSLG